MSKDEGTPAPLPRLRVLPEAITCIASDGGHAKVRLSPRHGCCGGTVYLPFVDLGKPDDPGRFHSIQIEEITIWLERGIEADTAEGLVIGVSGFWLFRKYWVDGAKSSM